MLYLACLWLNLTSCVSQSVLYVYFTKFVNQRMSDELKMQEDVPERMGSSDEDEREKHSSIENLEMAASRFSSDTRILVEDSIMTVSLDEDQRTEFLLDISQGRCRMNCHFMQRNALCMAVLSLMITTTVLLTCVIKVYGKNHFKKSVSDFLVITRYSSLFGFVGGVSVLISSCIVFSTSCGSYLCRYSRKEFGYIEAILRRFVENSVFEESFLKQYTRRAVAVEENSYSKALLEVLDSREFDSMLLTKVSEFLVTPEGFILGMFNFKEDILFSFCKAQLVEAISATYPLVVRRESQSDTIRPESVRRHILSIIAERFSGFDWKLYSRLLQRVTRRRRNLMTITSSLLMSFFGCGVGVLHVYYIDK